MGQFLIRQNLLGAHVRVDNLKKIGNLNEPIYIKEIELIIFQNEKQGAWDGTLACSKFY